MRAPIFSRGSPTGDVWSDIVQHPTLPMESLRSHVTFDDITNGLKSSLGRILRHFRVAHAYISPKWNPFGVTWPLVTSGIWKIWKKIEKWFGKYGRKASWIVKRYGIYRSKVSWIVKRYGKYWRNPSLIVKAFGKYGRKVSWIGLGFFHIFHIFSLFNLLSFHLSISYHLPFFSIFHIISHFNLLSFHDFHIFLHFSSVFSKSFHYSTCLSSIFSISFHISTYLSSVFSHFNLLF
jgi:hypothetical protein